MEPAIRFLAGGSVRAEASWSVNWSALDFLPPRKPRSIVCLFFFSQLCVDAATLALLSPPSRGRFRPPESEVEADCVGLTPLARFSRGSSSPKFMDARFPDGAVPGFFNMDDCFCRRAPSLPAVLVLSGPAVVAATRATAAS